MNWLSFPVLQQGSSMCQPQRPCQEYEWMQRNRMSTLINDSCTGELCPADALGNHMLHPHACMCVGLEDQSILTQERTAGCLPMCLSGALDVSIDARWRSSHRCTECVYCTTSATPLHAYSKLVIQPIYRPDDSGLRPLIPPVIKVVCQHIVLAWPSLQLLPLLPPRLCPVSPAPAQGIIAVSSVEYKPQRYVLLGQQHSRSPAHLDAGAVCRAVVVASAGSLGESRSQKLPPASPSQAAMPSSMPPGPSRTPCCRSCSASRAASVAMRDPGSPSMRCGPFLPNSTWQGVAGQCLRTDDPIALAICALN